MAEVLKILQILIITLVTSIPFVASIVPSVINENNEEYVPDCKGKCEGQWAQWTGWSECTEGECHLNYGKSNRQTYCYVMVKLPPSRADGGSDAPPPSWEVACRQIQDKECIQKRTCTGEWGGWGTWTECESSETGTGCSRSRRRICKDVKNQRLPGSHCYGGAANDTFFKKCVEKTCMGIPRLSLSESENKFTREPEAAVSNKKAKTSGLSHNTILIISVAIGSLVFGAIFVMLLMNVVRRTSARDDDSTSSRSDRWKRIGSTNTSSTGYSAGYLPANDVMSPRPDLRNLQSPSSTTTESGSSTASQIHFFGRNDSKSLVQPDLAASGGLLTVSGALGPKDGAERPRRSRLLNENIYWEITDSLAQETGSSGSSEQQQSAESRSNSPENDREVVHNVLYGSVV